MTREVTVRYPSLKQVLAQRLDPSRPAARLGTWAEYGHRSDSEPDSEPRRAPRVGLSDSRRPNAGSLTVSGLAVAKAGSLLVGEPLKLNRDDSGLG